MANISTVIRSVGGLFFVLGVGVVFSAFGRRTADPLVTVFFDDVTFVMLVGVVLVGLAFVGLGLGIAKQAERFEDTQESHDSR